MTAIEHKELKGITVKNIVVTLISTASIVASVMTTYFGLKNDITDIRTEQTTETRINNIRLKILEEQVALLQKQVISIRSVNVDNVPSTNSSLSKAPYAVMLSPVKKNK